MKQSSHSRIRTSASVGAHPGPVRARARAHGAATSRRGSTSHGPGHDAILAAAITEFAARGYDGATTAEIARRARVTQPLVHHHFGSKALLWRAAMDQLYAELNAAIGDTLFEGLQDLDPLDRLKVVLRQFVAFSAHRPEMARIMTHEGGRKGPRLTYLVDSYIQPLVGRLGTVVLQAIENESVKPLWPELMLFQLLGAATHLFNVPAVAQRMFAIDVKDPELVRRFADSLVELALHGFANTPRRAA
jgi:AcrR family transcriptional regulator